MDNFEQALSHIQQRIGAALACGTPLRIRGGGSKDFYAHSLQGEVLDTTGLRGIVSYEPSELVVTVGAGTPLAELEALLAEQGQCLPFEPPHFAWSGAGDDARHATVGGMVASGLAGPARASVGGVRDYVLGLKMVNGRNEHLSFGGQVMKNVAGYDVSRLMVGAMGTLGLITEVSLKVLPMPPGEATLVFALGQDDALEQLHRWGGQPLPLNASCWVHDDSGAPGTGRDLLFVRLRGAKAAVEAACHSMLADQTGTRMDHAQAQGDWRLCRDHGLPFFTHQPSDDMGLWRLSVAQTAAPLDVPWPQLIEWHGGLRWLWAPMEAAGRLRELAKQAGGVATLFIAAYAYESGPVVRFSLNNQAEAGIQGSLKSRFDPDGIFNPCRMFADM